MCTAGKATWDAKDLFTRPHRFFGLPSLIDPILHPNDEYNKPKIPEVTPPIERQAYKTPAPRDLSSSSSMDRRRAGVSTGSQGVTTPVSTTRLPVGGG